MPTIAHDDYIRELSAALARRRQRGEPVWTVEDDERTAAEMRRAEDRRHRIELHNRRKDR